MANPRKRWTWRVLPVAGLAASLAAIAVGVVVLRSERRSPYPRRSSAAPRRWAGAAILLGGLAALDWQKPAPVAAPVAAR
mgnify:CR=1 FL=1